MNDTTMTGLEMSRARQLMDDAERKLASYDLGMAVAVSTGLMVTARVVNMISGWM